ncbi:MAG: OsmC family protein [Candidatus Electryonea clarkiae]|nr:OsmC family protein [Candidatus Electryonea clarkiae]MDP8286013.1 OsmC family protein [Candidatus Electryonea clarkiae]
MPEIAHAILENVNKMKFVASTHSGHTLIMDAMPAVGGEDQGARPAELPFAGLAGCTGMDTISVLHKMRQPVTKFEVAVEGLSRADEHPKKWLEIRVIFHVEGEVDPKKLTRAIDLSRSRYCSVSVSLKPAMKINYRYILNGEVTDLPDEAGN